METVANCVIDPEQWWPIDTEGRNLSVGTGFERALDDARRKLGEETKESGKRVKLWIRGDVLLVKESGRLEIKTQPPTQRYELRATIEGVAEKWFKAYLITGQSEWIECGSKRGKRSG